MRRRLNIKTNLTQNAKIRLKKGIKQIRESETHNFLVRTFLTILLVSGFGFIFYLGPLYCSGLVFAITMLVYWEIISLKKSREKDKQLPYFYLLQWFLFSVCVYSMATRVLKRQLSKLTSEYPIARALSITHSAFITYCLILLGIVVFVTTFRKLSLKYQFQQLAWTLCSLLVIVVQGMAQVANIYEGLIWFLLPTSLVVCNDIMAYCFGKLIGKTQLIEVSPKKTLEGYLGASLMTILFAGLLTSLVHDKDFFICENSIHLHPFQRPTCDRQPTFQRQVYKFSFAEVEVSPMHIHAFVLSLFASLIAPFGGFFASGFKRAFRIKDFGESIPGHGGFTDRVDCQVLMGMFTYVYIHSFAKPLNLVDRLVVQFSSLSRPDQFRVYKEFGRILNPF